MKFCNEKLETNKLVTQETLQACNDIFSKNAYQQCDFDKC